MAVLLRRRDAWHLYSQNNYQSVLYVIFCQAPKYHIYYTPFRHFMAKFVPLILTIFMNYVVVGQ